MVKEAMECEVTEVHTDTVARLKDTLLSQEQFQNLGKTKKTSGRNISRHSDNSVCS